MPSLLGAGGQAAQGVLTNRASSTHLEERALRRASPMLRAPDGSRIRITGSLWSSCSTRRRGLPAVPRGREPSFAIGPGQEGPTPGATGLQSNPADPRSCLRMGSGPDVKQLQCCPQQALRVLVL